MFGNWMCIQFGQHVDSLLLQVTTYKVASETLRMWANAQCDGRPAEHRWRPLFNSAKFS